MSGLKWRKSCLNIKGVILIIFLHIDCYIRNVGDTSNTNINI